jgi:hypothetical protein
LSVTSRSPSGENSEEGMPHDIMNRMLMASRTLAARIERAECDTAGIRSSCGRAERT